MPSFIWWPSSLADPENGAARPNLISVSVTPRIGMFTFACANGDTGPGAPTDGTATAVARGGAGGDAGGVIESVAAGAVGVTAFSRLARLRSTAAQSVRRLVTALCPSVRLFS